MNDTNHCVHSQAIACAGPISLVDAQRRFAREATRGSVDTGRYRLPYAIWGEGPPLIFIHGLGDTSRSFWMPMALLSEQFRCIGYDLPIGRGDGARLWNYRHADLVNDLLALLDHLRLKQSYALGSSFGSTIALAAARLRPERLPRLILQGGFARRPLVRAELLLARLTSFLPGTMSHLPFRVKMIQRGHFEPFAGRSPEVWETFLDLTGQTPLAAAARHALILNRVDLRPILPQIRQPVLLVCGDRDPLIGAAEENVLLAGLPNAQRVVIPDCGHMPSYTHPETMAAVVQEFLTPPA